MACSRPTMKSSKRSTRRRIGVVAARQRRGLGRVLGDEGGAIGRERLFTRVVEERADPLAVRLRLAQHRAELVLAVGEPAVGEPLRERGAVVQHRPLEPRRQEAGARGGHDGVLHRDARPVAGEADLLALIGDLLAAGELAGELAEQRLGQHHQVGVGRVGLVELQHRELGVVLARQPLVAEVAADLVDPLEAADDQPLQVQLGRDPHVEIEVERVVVGLERLRRGAADDPVQHRRLHLEKTACIEKAANAAHERAPLAEHLAHLGVRHQVDVALAVADLGVRQAVKLLGQRPRRLGQDPHALGHDGQLARLHDRRAADHADEVAALRLLPERELRLAEEILADLDLDLPAAVQELREGHLPERPEVHDASGHRKVVVAQQRRARLPVVPGGRRRRRDAGELGQNLGRRVRRHEAVRIRISTKGANFRGLFLAFFNQLSFVGHFSPRDVNNPQPANTA